MYAACNLISLLLTFQRLTSSLSIIRGELRVSHEVVFVGETVVFECSVIDDSPPVNFTDMFIHRTHSYEPVGRVKFQNGTSLTVHMTVTSVDYSSTYYCIVTTSQRRFQLDDVTVNVEYPLKPVTHFTCVTREFLNLTCTYKLPLGYRRPRYILGQVLLYSLLDTDVPERLCLNDTSRTFRLPGHNLYTTYVFRVRLQHLLRGEIVKTSEEFVIDPMTVAIPPVVTQLEASNRSSTSLDLSWHLPDNIFGYISNVTYTAIWGSKEETFWQSVSSSVSETVQRTKLLYLTPGTTYRLSVQCRAFRETPQQAFSSYSDRVSIFNKTLDDVPGAAPRVAPAVSRPTASVIIMYWQKLDAKDEHGVLKHYEVHISDREGRSEHTVVSIEEYSLSVQLRSPQDELQCTVRAVNNVGPSPKSTITVTPQNLEPDATAFWVTSQDSNREITFHWYKMAELEAECLLFWCRGSLHERNCQGQISWISVKCYLQNVTVDTELDQRLLVGFSVKSSTPAGPVQSAIKWDHCIYIPDKVPSAPKEFKLSENQSPLSIEVVWRSPDCRDNYAYVSHYIISYCVAENVTCTGPVQRDTVSKQAVSHLIRVTDSAQYRVTIRAASRDKEGPDSLPIICIVKAAWTTLAVILPLSVVAVLATIVLLVITIRKINGFCDKRDHIHVPSGLCEVDTEKRKPESKKHHFGKRRKGWMSLNLMKSARTTIHIQNSDYQHPCSVSEMNAVTDTDIPNEMSGYTETSFACPSGAGSFKERLYDDYVITVATGDSDASTKDIDAATDHSDSADGYSLVEAC